MILVLLGTQNNSFVRLLDEIENCINNGIINEEVIVQAGHTKYTSEIMKIMDFIPVSELEDLLSNANLIITHGRGWLYYEWNKLKQKSHCCSKTCKI